MTSTRERVLDAATQLFAQQGYDATSVSQVIAANYQIVLEPGQLARAQDALARHP